VVIVTRCAIGEQAQGQYMRRLLPDFLIPYCRIRLHNVAEASALGNEERTTERVCRLLGCIDPRTAWRHLRRFEQAAERVVSELSMRRAASPEFGEFEEHRHATMSIDWVTMMECAGF